MELTLVEFFIRAIPESLIMIWGVYVISREHINSKNFILMVLINSLSMFFMRKLPIYFGAHMILNIVVLISITFIFGISIIKTIFSTLIVSILMIISELINLSILAQMHIEINNITNPFVKTLLGLPSLVILSVLIVIIDFILKKQRKKQTTF